MMYQRSIKVLAGFLILTAMFVAANVSAQSLFIDLGTLGAPVSTANAINEQGQVVGQSISEQLQSFGYIWQNGTMTALPKPEGTFAFATDINILGQPIGAMMTADGSDTDGIHQAVTWENDTMVHLGFLANGDESYAYGINKHGQIVGWSYVMPGTSRGARAFLWEDGVMTALGTLGGETSAARDINNRGQIVGVSQTASGESHAFLWDNGVMIDLGTLGGSTSTAHGINKYGQIVGRSLTVSGEEHAFLWDNGLMIDLGTLGGNLSIAEAINDCGQIVGYSRINSSTTTPHAFLWQDGNMIDIGTMGGDYSSARDINRFGQIVGSSNNADGELRGFIWTGVVTNKPCSND